MGNLISLFCCWSNNDDEKTPLLDRIANLESKVLEQKNIIEDHEQEIKELEYTLTAQNEYLGINVV